MPRYRVRIQRIRQILGTDDERFYVDVWDGITGRVAMSSSAPTLNLRRNATPRESARYPTDT
jgi:hypothetical protein